MKANFALYSEHALAENIFFMFKFHLMSEHNICLYLSALLGRLDVDLGSLLEGLSEDMSDQRFTGNLHGHHVPGPFKHCLGSGELTRVQKR